ncbi:putative transmembrane sensor kinase transcription regulator protein [Alloalcanivorax dieselolei B5]|uniref:histidine kinase n=2 Tax=Alloalcanivorax dieselolei TaxID=285091 RepID=K0CD51_ALCDB|nr:putative transmembrane sensor kinase transcription regulator protein [Alloalcanivorax dieselolei B5]GGK10472.1 two-component sensor histidine kinase [Alloalcanivorax dieselolei]
MALGITLLVVLTSYAFYFLALHYFPEQIDEAAWAPSPPEWLWLAATTVTGLVLAVIVAINLSRRILVPLNSVADSMRRVAQGDLNVRATAGDRSLGEAAELADDFNALAGQLQRVSDDLAFWNAAIAHELRTPVTILRGRLQGLAEGVFPPDESQFRSLLTQVEGLSRLIEDLRTVSLTESGHLDLQFQDIDLSAEIKDVVALYKEALEASGQRPALDLHTGPVYCDPMRIRQALLALLENARRHAVPGTIRIQSGMEDGWYFLRVEDNGPGIPSELFSQVFTAFRRVNPAHISTQDEGSGLGLAVVAAIAHAHKGQATCRPSSDGGSCFELSWPRGKAGY